MQSRILIQGHSEEQEEGNHDGLQADGHHEVFLGVLHVFASQGALHHVLIQARHGNDGEHAAEELLPEVLRGVDVVKMEKLHVAGIQFAHFLAHQDKGEAHCGQHAQGFENIHADDGLDAATHGVEPYEEHREHHRYPERYADGAEQQQLQGGAHQIQAGAGAQNLGDEEKPGSGLMGGHAETLVQVFVYRHHVELEVERAQHKGDDQVTKEKSHYHLEIAEPGYIYHTGDRHKGDTGKARPNHGNGHFPPGGGTGCVKVFFRHFLSFLYRHGQWEFSLSHP